MCVRVRTSIHVRICVPMHVCVSVRLRVSVHVRCSMCVFSRIYRHACVCAYARVYAYACVCARAMVGVCIFTLTVTCKTIRECKTGGILVHLDAYKHVQICAIYAHGLK